MQTISAINVAQAVLIDPLRRAKCIVDATAGNGNDTLFLAQRSGQDAIIYAFDIQQEAIRATEMKTIAFKDKIQYILDSHINLDKYIPSEIDIAIFNLGYLPGGNHEITTMPETTLESIEKAVLKLSINGLIVIIAYPGHEAGNEEFFCIDDYLKNLPMKKFTVGLYRMINHSNKSPVLYIVEKVRN